MSTASVPPHGAGWQRLDPRMLLIYPVKELIRFLPVLVGLFLFGTAGGGPDAWWHLVGVAIPVGLGLLRYATTSYRIASGRIELRRGLLNRHLLSTALDRVRTVEVTAPLVHRLLGLTTVRIGTGTASSDDDDHLDLDGLPAEQARRLRDRLLLDAGPGPAVPGAAAAGSMAPTSPVAPVVSLEPSWVRFAPLTSSGLVLAAGVLGVLTQALNTVGGFERLDPQRLADDAGRWSLWAAVPVATVGLAIALSLLAIGGYVVTNWGFALTHTRAGRGGAWHLRRGLLTTRETTLDEERVRGVSLAEPLGLRLVGGARASAIATGLDRGQRGSALLVPPAPVAVVRRVAGTVLGTAGPVSAPLRVHGRRAAVRRFTRAVGPTVALLVVAVVLAAVSALPGWVVVVVAVAVPLSAALAADRARGLGHALVDGHVVVRSGTLDRRREALATDGVIGWTFRSTWFQRRAGLVSLVATTAGGRQAVTAIDIPDQAALELAGRATPDLFGQFLAR